MAARKLNIRPDPDFSRFERVLKRSGIPDRVPFYELFSNIQKEVLKAIGKYQELPPHCQYPGRRSLAYQAFRQLYVYPGL